MVFDMRSTGFSPLVNKIIEIGAVKVEKGNITERFSTFVNPEVPIPFRIENLTGIKDDHGNYGTGDCRSYAGIS